MTKKLIPNYFQTQALAKLNKAISNGKRKGTIVMPTGTGKTFLSVLFVKKILQKNKKSKILFVCHNKDILVQASEKEFKKRIEELHFSYGYYHGTEKNVKQITFATIQSLGRNKSKFKKDLFDYIIVDEAHHYASVSYSKTISYFKPKFQLSLTATPYRTDRRDIAPFCGSILYKAKIRDVMSKGILSKIHYFAVNTDIDYDRISRKHGLYSESDLNKLLFVKEFDQCVIQEYKSAIKKHKRKKTICFCASIEHAFRMEDFFNKNGIKAASYTSVRRIDDNISYKTGSSKYDFRKSILKDFKKGAYDVICVVDMFNEGIDIPDADMLLMLRPTNSSIVFTQQIGRGLRKKPGKNYLLVLDFTSNASRCEINFDVLYALTGIDVKKEVKKKLLKDGPDQKEMIFVSNGSKITINKTKIDIIKKKTITNLTKKEFISCWNNLKDSLGRVPTRDEISKKIIPYSQFRLLFDCTYTSFVKEHHGKLRKNQFRYTKKQIVEKYESAKNILGEVPTSRQLSKLVGLHDTTIKRHFGITYGQFVKLQGD